MATELEFKPNIAQAVRRMERFWNLEEPEDRVPAAVYLPESDLRKADGSLYGMLKGYIGHMEEYFARHAAVPDEYFPSVVPQYGHTILSAICGCGVRHSAETLWSIPFATGPLREQRLSLQWGNEWSVRFREDIERLLEAARGKYTVGQYELEGVSDTYAAVRGAQELFYDFADDPEAAHAFTAQIVDILIEFGRWNQCHVSDRQDLMGGITTVYPIWMPAGSCVTTEDHSVMFSREYYARTIRPHTGRFTSSFARTLMEVHAEGNHQLGSYAGMDGVSLMTIENPLKMNAEHRAMVRSMLGKKCFRFGVEPDNIEETLEFTGVTGIMPCLAAGSADEAMELLDKLERATQKIKKSRRAGLV